MKSFIIFLLALYSLSSFADSTILKGDSCVLNIADTSCDSSVYNVEPGFGPGRSRIVTNCTFYYSTKDLNTGDIHELSRTKNLVLDSAVNDNGVSFILNLVTLDSVDGINVQVIKSKSKKQLTKQLDLEKSELKANLCNAQ